MTYRELAVLLPCDTLEDFPQHHTGDEANGLLAAWTSVWHPQLLAATERGPSWHRADTPPEVTGDHLIVVPSISQPDLPPEFRGQATEIGAEVIVGLNERSEILRRALAARQIEPLSDEDLAADFLALGFCFLQAQLLTRQMRYSSNLDEPHFFRQLMVAVRHAVEGEGAAARDQLSACFDMLGEDRDHYYSVDAYVLDLTIANEGSHLEPLLRDLAQERPSNLLVSGHVIKGQHARNRELVARLAEGAAAGHLSIIGGEYNEEALPLVSCETLLTQLRRGASCYEECLGSIPQVFFRRRFGLTPLLPQVLNRLGYHGALHFTLDDGRFPLGNQTKTRWEGWGDAATDAIAKVPLDASRPETYLGLAQRLGESMDLDHVATLTFAHWAGQTCDWHEDLRRCARYGGALGKFVTADEYFRETYMPGHLDNFAVDQYHSPYLKQATEQRVASSSHAEYWAQEIRQRQSVCLRTLIDCVEGRVQTAEEIADTATEDTGEPAELARRFARSLAAAYPEGESEEKGGGDGYLLVNASPQARRALVDVSELAALPAVGKPIFAAQELGDKKWAIVDIPGLGYTFVAAGASTPSPAKALPDLAEDARPRDGVFVLRNEYFEAFINPSTGALQSLKDYSSRNNRLSQQLAVRYAQEGGASEYTQMIADEVAVSSCNELCGELTSRGRLVDRQGTAIANFEQRFRVERGNRVLRLEINVESQREIQGDPWTNCLCSRWAWADESAELFRSVQETRQRTSARRCDAPLYIEIEHKDTRTALLTGGLPFHRRSGPRALDTLLPSQQGGEFRLGIAVDPPNVLDMAHQLLVDSVYVSRLPASQLSASGWLFNLDAKQVASTHCSGFGDETLEGIRIRLLETQGQPARSRLRCFRSIRSAKKTDFLGNSLGDCQVVDDDARIELAPFEWAEFEVLF